MKKEPLALPELSFCEPKESLNSSSSILITRKLPAWIWNSWIELLPTETLIRFESFNQFTHSMH